MKYDEALMAIRAKANELETCLVKSLETHPEHEVTQLISNFKEQYADEKQKGSYRLYALASLCAFVRAYMTIRERRDPRDGQG